MVLKTFTANRFGRIAEFASVFTSTWVNTRMFYPVVDVSSNKLVLAVSIILAQQLFANLLENGRENYIFPMMELFGIDKRWSKRCRKELEMSEKLLWEEFKVTKRYCRRRERTSSFRWRCSRSCCSRRYCRCSNYSAVQYWLFCLTVCTFNKFGFKIWIFNARPLNQSCCW